MYEILVGTRFAFENQDTWFEKNRGNMTSNLEISSCLYQQLLQRYARRAGPPGESILTLVTRKFWLESYLIVLDKIVSDANQKPI
jgi:hypothetical protein